MPLSRWEPTKCRDIYSACHPLLRVPSLPSIWKVGRGRSTESFPRPSVSRRFFRSGAQRETHENIGACISVGWGHFRGHALETDRLIEMNGRGQPGAGAEEEAGGADRPR